MCICRTIIVSKAVKLKDSNGMVRKFGMTVKLSACYITKNEEQNLARSLNSLKGQVDELIVVDTGSTDRTVSIAKQYNAKVFHFKWQDDFSAPRNFAIDRVTGDWIVFLDADESFAQPSTVRKSIEKLLQEHPDKEAIMIPRCDIDRAGKEISRDFSLRIFRNCSHLRYHGMVHENIRQSDGKIPNFCQAGKELLIMHTGYASESIARKKDRNLDLLKKEIARQGIEQVYCGELSQEYFIQQDYKKALHYAKLAVQSNLQPVLPDSDQWHIILESMRQLAYPLNEQLAMAEKAVADKGEFPELWGEMGMILCGLNRLDEAEKAFRHSIALYEMPDSIANKSGYMKAAAPVIYERYELLRKMRKEKNMQQTEKKKIYISAGYIVKNAAKDLERSLKSIAGQADEILVADTGSTDDTVAIAKKYGATVFSVVWQDDFAAVRNEVLVKARGEWMVFLDADEYFTAETSTHIRPLLTALQAEPVNGILVPLVNIDEDDDNRILDETLSMRIYRLHSDVHYQGLVHEEVQNVQPVIRADKTDLKIIHTGYSAKRQQEKSRRYLRLMQKSIENGADISQMYHYLADCYRGLDDEKNAEKYARLDIALGRQARTNASSSYRIMLSLLATAAGRQQERLAFCRQAVKDFPELPEFHAEYAQVLALCGQYGRAVKEADIALDKWQHPVNGTEVSLFTGQMGEQLTKQRNIWQSPQKDGSKYVQEMAKNIRQLADAIQFMDDKEYFDCQAVQELPDGMKVIFDRLHGGAKLSDKDAEIYRMLLNNVLYIYEPEKWLKYAEIAMDFSDRKRCELALFLLSQKAFEAAFLLYQSIPANSWAADSDFWRGTGICLFHLREYESAYEALERAKKMNCQEKDVSVYQEWCLEALEAGK